MFLAVSVIVSEEAPVFLVVCAIVLAAALRWGRGRLRKPSIALAAIATLLATLPILALPGTISRCNDALDALTNRPWSPDETTARAPFEPARAFGIASLAAPVVVDRDLPVPLRDGGRLALDVYRSSHSGPQATAILIYGGAWQFGQRANDRRLATDLVALGYTAIAIDYRHAPRYRFPTQSHDVSDALDAIARHASAWGVDPDRVAVIGESAGAELALLAAYGREHLHIRAAVGIYAPLDLAGGYRDPPMPDPADVRAILRAYLGGTPDRFPATYVAASPRSFVRPSLPPTLLIGGDRDELVAVRYQRDMASALSAAGDRVASLEFPWSNHGFAALPGGLAGQLSSFYLERFLAETLHRRFAAR